MRPTKLSNEWVTCKSIWLYFYSSAVSQNKKWTRSEMQHCIVCFPVKETLSILGTWGQTLCWGYNIDANTNTYTSSVPLTALNLQGAVLLIQWVSAQVHHAGSCRRDPKRENIWRNILITDDKSLMCSNELLQRYITALPQPQILINMHRFRPHHNAFSIQVSKEENISFPDAWVQHFTL